MPVKFDAKSTISLRRRFELRMKNAPAINDRTKRTKTMARWLAVRAILWSVAVEFSMVGIDTMPGLRTLS